jgi:hypothetical protein
LGDPPKVFFLKNEKCLESSEMGRKLITAGDDGGMSGGSSMTPIGASGIYCKKKF